MNRTKTILVCSGLTLALYTVAIVVGLTVNDLSSGKDDLSRSPGRAWQPPSSMSIPSTPRGDSIRRGALIFDETPIYASKDTPSKISCSSCHAGGGMQPFASPVVGMTKLFPMFNARAGRVISLPDRIEECFVRSENGQPIPYSGATMQDLLAYIGWLSTPQPDHQPYHGRGLISLPLLTPNPTHGQNIYATQCAGCHGTDGQGRAPLFPPVWGPMSFNDGAGLDSIQKMAAFVQHNMPQNRMGILSPQEAYDVAAFIHAQPRPAFNNAYKKF